jgi:hypothetical protein
VRWFANNERLCGYAAAPVGFANELLTAAEAYSKFMAGYDQHGVKNRHLEDLKLLGGHAARQHLILLLAGRHLPGELFNRLAREVEDLFFVYVITREPTREFERAFARWAVEIRGIANQADLDAFINRRFMPAKGELSARFSDAFRRLQVGSVQQYRLRYILAKMTQYIDLQAYGETEGTKWLARYTGADLEIEHIFPQQPGKAATEEFGEYKDPGIANYLGNLVLVEKPINASLGNCPFSVKRKVYNQSQLLLTKAVAERPKIGVNTKIDIAVADLHPFTDWNEASVIERQEELTVLAQLIWRLPGRRQGQ